MFVKTYIFFLKYENESFDNGTNLTKWQKKLFDFLLI